MYTVRDRQTHGITSGATKDVSEENWPFVIDAPSPPFALGEVVALIVSKELANRITQLLNTESELLALAQETSVLFHEAEEYRLSRFFFIWGNWFKIQSKALAKVVDFGLEYAKARRAKRQTLYFTSSGPPLVVVCETNEHAQATRQRAKEWGNQEVNEAAYREALAEWTREWKRMRNVEKEG